MIIFPEMKIRMLNKVNGIVFLFFYFYICSFHFRINIADSQVANNIPKLFISSCNPPWSTDSINSDIFIT